MLFFILKLKDLVIQNKNTTKVHASGIYKKMSLFISSKETVDCEKHHINLIKKYGTNDNIIEYFKKNLIFEEL